jgi:hypothetical protein
VLNVAQVLHYYLVDDTLEIREVHESNDGRDPFPVLLKRQKVPRNPRALPVDFPTITLEPKETELTDTLTPIDFAVGDYVFIYNRSGYALWSGFAHPLQPVLSLRLR